jgi:hypothetical protein
MLRVPGASMDDVERVLSAAPAGGSAQADRVYQAPATLEERFFELTLAADRSRATA